MTQRGDLVTVSLQGDYGKPRPALVVQSDLLTRLDRYREKFFFLVSPIS